MSKFVLRNANLLDLEEGALIDGMDVVVIDDKIADIGRGLVDPSEPTPFTTCGALRSCRV